MNFGTWTKSVFLLFFFFLQLHQEAFSAEEKPINNEMQSMAQDVQKLIPYLFSEEKFKADKNHETINGSLSAIVAKLQHIKKHSQVQTTGKQITIQELREQMVVALHHFNSERKVVARMEVSSLLNLCVNCHTQVAGSSNTKLFGPLNVSEMQLTNYEKGTVYFLTRDYEKALALFRELVMEPGKDDINIPFVREKSLNYILTYFLRLESDLTASEKELDTIAANKNTQKFILDKISEWKKEFKNLKALSQELNSLKSDKEINAFIDKNLSKLDQGKGNALFEDKEIVALYLSGILSGFLERPLGNKLKSKILYWLAIYDKRLNAQLFYSLGDAYLQLCIKQTPHSEIASQCFQVMEEDTLFHYSGSMGTNLPENVKAELLQWKKLSEVKSNKKRNKEKDKK
ncbi:MAG: hypothetical protein QE271_10735 [Bacteriovoracaceae bacterium]|nr:hypothetical protein [Bacteriovoracaceae bacterium]